MPGPEVAIEVVGDKVAAERLLLVGERASDVRPIRPLLDPKFRRDEETRFALDGPGWKTLNETTVALKVAAGMDSRILRRTGELERALTKPGEGVEVGLTSSRTELAFGTDVSYARFHQYGQGVPKRELIDLRPATIESMAVTVQEYVVDGLEV
jgi:phage gpG-like protein